MFTYFRAIATVAQHPHAAATHAAVSWVPSSAAIVPDVKVGAIVIGVVGVLGLIVGVFRSPRSADGA